VIRKIVYAIFIGIIIAGVLMFLSAFPFGENKMLVGKYYIENATNDAGAPNVVTAVTLLYRGFDTLGEVMVLFTAALGVSIIFAVEEKKKKVVQPPNFVVRVGSRIVFTFILLTGFYIFMHGHLTPGGGFQGGALIATGFLLLYLSYSDTGINRKRFMVAEGLGGIIYVFIGLIGLFVKGSFLANFLPKGTMFDLLSAGILLPLYIAIGLKVGSEFAGIVDDFMCEARCTGGEG